MKFVKKEKYPTTWCPGCGIGLVLRETANAMEKAGLRKKSTCWVSGIGCVGRSSIYIDLDSIHTLHGRAFPVAEGIKKVRPDLKVIIFSGDGDLLSIGAGHLPHCARRNPEMTAIYINNYVFGMTGGQASPTLKKERKLQQRLKVRLTNL